MINPEGTMKITSQTINTLTRVITGDSKISPYRSGPDLVDFFNQYRGLEFINNSKFIYDSSFPGREKFTKSQLMILDNIGLIKEVIENALDPRHYLDSSFDLVNVADHLNKYLVYDGIEAVKQGLYYCVRNKESLIMALLHEWSF